MVPVRLYSTCNVCGGRGHEAHHAEGRRADTCPLCHGLGSVLTEEGNMIAGLVKAAKLEGMLPVA